MTTTTTSIMISTLTIYLVIIYIRCKIFIIFSEWFAITSALYYILLLIRGTWTTWILFKYTYEFPFYIVIFWILTFYYQFKMTFFSFYFNNAITTRWCQFKLFVFKKRRRKSKANISYIYFLFLFFIDCKSVCCICVCVCVYLYNNTIGLSMRSKLRL